MGRYKCPECGKDTFMGRNYPDERYCPTCSTYRDTDECKEVLQ